MKHNQPNGMRNIDSKMHARGESIYVDDIPEQIGTLHAAVFSSPIAHGTFDKIDLSEAEKEDGVVKIFTAKDIPGENQIGSIIQDEPLLADKELHYNGMPVAIVVATNPESARRAANKIKLDYKKLQEIMCPREAKKKEKFIISPRTFSQGNIDSAWKKCEHLIEGTAEMGGQEHLYLEPHGAYVYHTEEGHIKIFSSTQAPSYVQKGVSKVLGLPMHKIEVDVKRIGGGFGGKEDQGTPWASMAALASYHLKRPVKLILSREEDFRMSGKRHPYSFDYKLGINKDLRIEAYEVTCYQNAGASADVSPAVMERTLFHGTNSYFIPNAKITVYSCRTNMAPNTAFRGFGAPQGMFVMEAAIAKISDLLKIDSSIIQRKNLLQEGNSFPYGQLATNCNALPCWETLEKSFETEGMKKEIDQFNKKNKTIKKGMAFFPLCFGISFTKTSLNQAGSLVHIFNDGSVSVTTGVIEMGQAVNTKILQVAAQTLSISPDRITINSTNTTRIANASPTAASTGADLNGQATLMACQRLYGRLKKVAAEKLECPENEISIHDEQVYRKKQKTDLEWEKLIFEAHETRAGLSEHAYYKTPDINFDKSKEKGSPFSYHAYGTAVTTITLDCLRGVYEVDSVKIIHDFGTSMNLHIDHGQIEGALAQGIGLMSIEELTYVQDGWLKTGNLSSYKIPDIYTVPKQVEIRALETEGAKHAIFGSKAVGEPPLCYGIGTYFAALNAMRAFNPNFKLKMDAPMTYQKCLLSIYEEE